MAGIGESRPSPSDAHVRRSLDRCLAEPRPRPRGSRRGRHAPWSRTEQAAEHHDVGLGHGLGAGECFGSVASTPLDRLGPDRRLPRPAPASDVSCHATTECCPRAATTAMLRRRRPRATEGAAATQPRRSPHVSSQRVRRMLAPRCGVDIVAARYAPAGPRPATSASGRRARRLVGGRPASRSTGSMRQAGGSGIAPSRARPLSDHVRGLMIWGALDAVAPALRCRSSAGCAQYRATRRIEVFAYPACRTETPLGGLPRP